MEGEEEIQKINEQCMSKLKLNQKKKKKTSVRETVRETEKSSNFKHDNN